MRIRSTDPELRRYDDNAPLVTCPECHAFMVPLSNHEISADEHPTLDAGGLEYFLLGLWAYVYNLIFGAANFAARKRKLEKLKEEVLPNYPDALVCPRVCTRDERVVPSRRLAA